MTELPLILYWKATGWESPTGHSNGGLPWQDPELAYDGNTATRALCTVNAQQWGPFLMLTPSVPAIFDAVRFFAKWHAEDINAIDVDAEYLGAWHHVFEGAYADDQWVEKKIPDGKQLVSQARVRFYNTEIIADIAHLWEFAFGVTGELPLIFKNGSVEYPLIQG